MTRHMHLDPFRHDDVQYWSRKWGVSGSDLYNAIMDTGSTSIETLKENLEQKRLIHPFLSKCYTTLRNMIAN